MALNKISQPYLSKPLRLISTLMMHRAVSFYPAGPVQQSGLVKNGAGNGNRTRLSCLEGRRTSRCTTPASKRRGTPRNAPREDRNLKKGEKIFFFPYVYIIQNFFLKINSFANEPTMIFLICFITIGEWLILPSPFMPSFDKTLPILLKRSADCFIVANRIIV